MNYTSAVFAAAVTIYYWWQNIKGIEESSDKALRVMQITTIMVVVLFIWGGYSLLVRGFHMPPFPSTSNLKFSCGRARASSKARSWCRCSACLAFSWRLATPSWP